MTEELVPLAAPIAATPRKETDNRFNFSSELTKVSYFISPSGKSTLTFNL